MAAATLTSSMVIDWLLPPNFQIGPTKTFSDRLASLCFQVTTDGFTLMLEVDHKMGINAADLAAGYPLVEIYNPQTNPIPASTGATHTTLTGAPAQLGVTVLQSLASSIIFAFATPAGLAGTTFQVLLSRNPASTIPA
jgi:hypothetical protein